MNGRSPLRDFFFIKKFGVLESPLFSTYSKFVEYAEKIENLKWKKIKAPESLVSQQFNIKRTDVSVRRYYKDFKKVAEKRLRDKGLKEFEVSAIMADFDEIFSDHLKSELKLKQKSTA